MKYYDNDIEIEVKTEREFEYVKAWIASKAQDMAAAGSIADFLFDEGDSVHDLDLRLKIAGNYFEGDPTEICVEEHKISLYACSSQTCGLSVLHAINSEIGEFASVTGRVISDNGGMEGVWYDNGQIVTVDDLIEQAWDWDASTPEGVRTSIGKKLDSIFEVAKQDYQRDFAGDPECPMPRTRGIEHMVGVMSDVRLSPPQYWRYLGEKVENEFRCLSVAEIKDKVTWREFSTI